jgi:hypothetical protein
VKSEGDKESKRGITNGEDGVGYAEGSCVRRGFGRKDREIQNQARGGNLLLL